MVRLRAAAVNVDVDSLYLYYRLHDLDEARATNAVWERGVLRFAELFERVGIKGTFFVVSQDLERWPEARRICADLAAAGHEIASHSHTHPYDLTRLDAAAISEELIRSRQLLGEVRGAPVTGFRAPGYTMTDQTLSLIADAGYAYDSSIFPCPPYYMAKLAVLATMAIRRKKSASIVGDPRVMWADRLPYWDRAHSLRELPVTVLPGLRFPFIGTSLLMMGERGYRVIRPWLKSTSFVNLEFHGIDLCDLNEDGIDPALLKQPDLRVPLEAKMRLFERVLTDLRDGWGVQTLETLTASLGQA